MLREFRFDLADKSSENYIKLFVLQFRNGNLLLADVETKMANTKIAKILIGQCKSSSKLKLLRLHRNCGFDNFVCKLLLSTQNLVEICFNLHCKGF